MGCSASSDEQPDQQKKGQQRSTDSSPTTKKPQANGSPQTTATQKPLNPLQPRQRATVQDPTGVNFSPKSAGASSSSTRSRNSGLGASVSGGHMGGSVSAAHFGMSVSKSSGGGSLTMDGGLTGFKREPIKQAPAAKPLLASEDTEPPKELTDAEVAELTGDMGCMISSLRESPELSPLPERITTPPPLPPGS